MSEWHEVFLGYSADKLLQYTSRIQDCLSRLTDEQIWMRSGENQNAIGNLVLHLCGNVRQWIGSAVGGGPDSRQRDAEFAARAGTTPAELIQRLTAAVEEATGIIRSLTAANLAEITTVQRYTLSKLEAVYHVVEHFSGHTGQIIFATKLLTGEDPDYYRHLSSVIDPIKNLDRVP